MTIKKPNDGMTEHWRAVWSGEFKPREADYEEEEPRFIFSDPNGSTFRELTFGEKYRFQNRYYHELSNKEKKNYD